MGEPINLCDKKDGNDMENRSTIVLADANEEFRSSLQQAIEETGEFTVGGSTGDGMAALQLVAELRPQLLVADLLLPSLDGCGLLERMESAKVQAKTIVVSALYRDQIVA